MGTESITLKEAYIIENLRKQDLTDEQLIQLPHEVYEKWDESISLEDFDLLKNLATKDEKKYRSVIKSGYKVKFLTIHGLINLIQLKFNKEKEVDFKVHEDGISGLKLDGSSILVIEQFLSQNWKIIKNGEFIEVRSVNA